MGSAGSDDNSFQKTPGTFILALTPMLIS